MTQNLCTPDAERLKLAHSKRGLVHLSPAYQRQVRRGSPLGTDHPALVLHRVAERRANAAACEKLSAGIEQSDLQREAHTLSAQGRWAEAEQLLRQAKQLSRQARHIESAYERNSLRHLQAMRHALSAAVLLEILSDTKTDAVAVALDECTAVTDTRHSDEVPSAPSAEGLELAAHLSANAPGFGCSTYAADPYSPDETEGGA